MSETPRTDEQILHHDNGNGHPSAFVFASFARQLETELADKGKQLAEARADARDRDNALAAIMAVLPDSAKPCDAPDLIRFFKQQMSAYSSRGIELEKQLADARAEIERKDKLIEQMREALRLALPEARSTHVEWAIKIALKAERGEE